MLICQHEFPLEYDPTVDEMHSADSDRIFQWDYEHADRCFKEHTDTGDQGLGHWARSRNADDVLRFAIDALKADKETLWTGHRILATVNRSNGYVVYSIQLFAKGKKSKTKTYCGDFGKNVRGAGTPWHDKKTPYTWYK